jgi:heme oxygenase
MKPTPQASLNSDVDRPGRLDLPLADQLKLATWDLHKEAETTGFINQLLRGSGLIENYIWYLENLRAVYEELESSYDWVSFYPELTFFVDRKIQRAASLALDIDALKAATGCADRSELLPVTRKFQTTLQRALHKRPAEMLAHIYVRYLGDLNGGQILKRLISKQFDLPDDCLTFYEFPLIADIATFRTRFRQALNGIHLEPDDLLLTKQAAIEAFRFNIAMSKALEKRFAAK